MVMAAVAALVLVLPNQSDAKPRKAIQEPSQCVFDNSGRHTCPGSVNRILRASAVDASGNEVQVIGRRPPGCPRRYCGCGASLYLFGRIVPELNLAANWIRKFPRTSPAPRMAAARRGHVFVLLSHVSGNDWLVMDANSGGGKTRIHVRSIQGFVIVNPHGRMVAPVHLSGFSNS